MACERPIPATRESDGFVTLREDRLSAELEDGEYLELACGRCGPCRTKRVRSWAIRCFHESQMHTRLQNGVQVPNGCFITLTYDDEHLPEDGSLHVEHWQGFAKRLRNRFGSFRFLHCGEYGPKGGRPHYHACLFGLDFHHDRVVRSREMSKVVWESPSLSQAWGKGFTTMAPLNFATASYTAGYVVKKMRNAEWDMIENVYDWSESGKVVSRRKPEYITMSRGRGKKEDPVWDFGLGHGWFVKYWREVYPDDQVVIDGKFYKPPGYYDRLLEEYHPDVWREVEDKRKVFLDAQGPSSDNVLRARSENFAARYAMKPERMDH